MPPALITPTQTDTKASRRIRQLLADQKIRKVLTQLKHLHPADVAEYLEDYTPKERTLVFSQMDDVLAGKVLCALDEDLQVEVARSLGRERLVKVLDELPSDELVDILSQLSEERVASILALMDAEDAAEAKELLQYEEDSAGGIMSVDVLYFDDAMTVRDCVRKIREHRDELENLSYLYVTDAERRLTGVVSVKSLVLAEDEVILGSLMSDKPLVAVRLDDDQEEVARMVAKYDLLAVPVVDETDRLAGIVHVDDVIDVIEEEATEDIYAMAGLDEEAVEAPSAVVRALLRTRWLVATVAGSLTAGAVISLLAPADPKVGMALAAFIPAIMGLGGGVAIQSATLLIRGLATGEIEAEDVAGFVRGELGVALLLGLIIGSLLFCAAFFWKQAWIIAAIVGGTMLIQAAFAALVGLVIPLALSRVGIDPAVAAGPLTQMTCDVTGLLIYFSFAHVVLRAAGAAG